MFFKKYASIKGYLERETILSFGKLKIRYHKILSPDGTPYLHSHPFRYLSIILWGGYSEQILVGEQIITKTHKIGSIILRSAETHHRITKAKNCRTLFFAFDSSYKWQLKKHNSIIKEDFKIPTQSGIYLRVINGREVYCKFDNFWYIGSSNKLIAEMEERLSIYQVGNWSSI